MQLSMYRTISASFITLSFFGCGGGSERGPVSDGSAPTTPAPMENAAPVAATSEGAPDAATNFPSPAEHQGAALTYSIIDAPNGTFGYDIHSDGKLLIHQTNLPGQPGVEGCKTKADAEKLAAFVMEKIKKGEMPPTVTTEELKTLGPKDAKP